MELLAEAVRRIEGAARAVWPGCRAALFGSQATGLALPGADLDVVVLGASADLRRAGSGFTKVSPTLPPAPFLRGHPARRRRESTCDGAVSRLAAL